MGINIGGIDIAQSTLDNEFRVLVLEKIVQKLINQMGGTSVLSASELEQIRTESFKELQNKYPNAGLKRNQ
jgi:hypothetical protein